MVTVKIKKLNPEAVIPAYATPGSSGFDLVAVEDVIVKPGETVLVKTGLSVEMDDGYELQIRPRSGISFKTKLVIPNAPGTVDSDFRGQICVIMRHSGYSDEQPVEIKKGDRIAQGVIASVVKVVFAETEELTDTQRGSGGMGSTGK